MYQYFWKRVVDFLVALISLIILIIPMVIVAVLIKLDSKGPVFFKQERYGLNSKPFMMYKFRSMEAGAPIKANHDFDDIQSHITKFGMFIRKTSVDELPQLWNVLKGDMSVIGPRALASTDQLVLDLRKQNGADQVRPGITGLAQVNGRNNLSDRDKAAYDAKYASHLTMRLDILLIVETLVSVIKREGVFKETISKNDERDIVKHD